MKIEQVPIDKIHFEHRYRIDVGDVESLAQSIREMGLLQPIGVDRYYTLIFGARRLMACADILQWKDIPAVILDIESVLAGEYAENVFRKQFTPSEMAALGKAIEEELLAKERRGQPKKESSANAENTPKGNAVDIAAKAVGFGSAETLVRAMKVVEKGTPELQRAMDENKVSISAAASIASQPKEEQTRILAMPKDERGEVVRQIQKTKANREADERRALDVRIYCGLREAVQALANHAPSGKETWAGLERVSAYDFGEYLPKAIACLARIEKEHPNSTPRPKLA